MSLVSVAEWCVSRFAIMNEVNKKACFMSTVQEDTLILVCLNSGAMNAEIRPGFVCLSWRSAIYL